MQNKKDLETILKNWYEQRTYYESELSTTTNPGIKFELNKRIQECNEQIKLLEERIRLLKEEIKPPPKSSTRPPQRKILVLCANPKGTSQLRISEEVREIKKGLKDSKQGNLFSIEIVESVRYRDISKTILEYEPDIIHFSGHGSGDDGLLFEDEMGNVKLVSAEALAGLFKLFSNQIECVVLNACYSHVQAEAIAQHIRHVIGMSSTIGDKAAIEFSIGFYSALGSGRSYDFAYELGCQAIKLSGESGALTPDLLGKSHYRGAIDSTDVEQESPKKALDSIQLTAFEFEVVELNNRGEETNRKNCQTQLFCEEIEEQANLEMVAIPGGVFQMGSLEMEEGNKSNECPQHSVKMSSFYMSRFPITQAQWNKVASLPQVKIPLNKVRPKFKGEDLPMEGVSWFEAVEFCARLSRYTQRQYQLPSEAEWEYACRAGSTTRYHFGDTISTSFANFNGAKVYGSDLKGVNRRQTTPVGYFGVSNAFGLSDMHGNVCEWCADPWHENYEQAPQNGSIWGMTGQSRRQVIRGGAYNQEPNNCRSATRNYLDPNRRTGFVVGFRVVLH